MKYSPECKNTFPLLLTITLTAFALVAIMAAGVLFEVKWLFQLLFICFATAALEILLRYVLTSFEYKCENGELLVNKTVGKKSTLVAKIDLAYSVTYLVPESGEKKEEEAGTQSRIREKYNYIRNLRPDTVCSYIFTAGSIMTLVRLEASGEFVEYVNNEIDKAIEEREKRERED